jgi:hypothetical protein
LRVSLRYEISNRNRRSNLVNVSELGLVTTSGKVVWGKWAQVTNTPENDGCVRSVLGGQFRQGGHCCGLV